MLQPSLAAHILKLPVKPNNYTHALAGLIEHTTIHCGLAGAPPADDTHVRFPSTTTPHRGVVVVYRLCTRTPPRARDLQDPITTKNRHDGDHDQDGYDDGRRTHPSTTTVDEILLLVVDTRLLTAGTFHHTYEQQHISTLHSSLLLPSRRLKCAPQAA